MKNKIIFSSALAILVIIGLVYFVNKDSNVALETPTPTVTPDVLSSGVPSPSPRVSIVPLPTGDGRTSFVGESVPWSLLLGDASCELKGELKFINANTYDNQDALFIYKGIDNPGRNVVWTVTPQDDISVGPNVFNKTAIPNGQSLIGLTMPQNPKYKKYELTAKINYGRLVNKNGKFVTVDGNVKVFEKQCTGKTTVVLP